MSEMPKVLVDLTTMINRFPASDVWRDNWRRLRLAVTPEEHEEIREYFLGENGWFVTAIRGVPLFIDEHPTHPIMSYEERPKDD